MSACPRGDPHSSRVLAEKVPVKTGDDTCSEGMHYTRSFTAAEETRSARSGELCVCVCAHALLTRLHPLRAVVFQQTLSVSFGIIARNSAVKPAGNSPLPFHSASQPSSTTTGMQLSHSQKPAAAT